MPELQTVEHQALVIFNLGSQIADPSARKAEVVESIGLSLGTLAVQDPLIIPHWLAIAERHANDATTNEDKWFSKLTLGIATHGILRREPPVNGVSLPNETAQGISLLMEGAKTQKAPKRPMERVVRGVLRGIMLANDRNTDPKAIKNTDYLQEVMDLMDLGNAQTGLDILHRTLRSWKTPDVSYEAPTISVGE